MKQAQRTRPRKACPGRAPRAIRACRSPTGTAPSPARHRTVGGTGTGGSSRAAHPRCRIRRLRSALASLGKFRRPSPALRSPRVTPLSEKAALVTLVRNGHRSRQAYAELVEEAGSATAVLALEQLLEPEAAEEVATWEAEGIKLVSVLDPDYPENLRAVHDRPPLIFVAGELRPEDARAVALIGSRRASGDGLAAARPNAEHLVERGFTVLSGLAAGIDTAAHTAAPDTSRRTVAVIGTGFRTAYPPQNNEIQ